MVHKPFHRQEPFKCSACGYKSCKPSYCSGRVKESKSVEGVVTKTFSCSEEEEGPHMHRCCQGCGYVEIRGMNPEGSTYGGYAE